MTQALPFDAGARIARSPQQLSCDLDGQVVLLSVANGRYYNINEMGSRIWAMLEHPTTAAAIVQSLHGDFEVDLATCDAEVRAFLTQLHTDGLLRAL